MHTERERSFSLLIVQDADGGVGKDGVCPWDLPVAAAYMEKVLADARPRMRHATIMDEQMFVALPPRKRPLPGAFSIIVNESGRIQPSRDLGIARDLDTALAIAFARRDVDMTYVVGGYGTYIKAIDHGCCREVRAIRLLDTQQFDLFLPASFALDFWLSSITPPFADAVPYRLERYRRRMPWVAGDAIE